MRNDSQHARPSAPWLRRSPDDDEHADAAASVLDGYAAHDDAASAPSHGDDVPSPDVPIERTGTQPPNFALRVAQQHAHWTETVQ